jgi:hypothetical protein
MKWILILLTLSCISCVNSSKNETDDILNQEVYERFEELYFVVNTKMVNTINGEISKTITKGYYKDFGRTYYIEYNYLDSNIDNVINLYKDGFLYSFSNNINEGQFAKIDISDTDFAYIFRKTNKFEKLQPSGTCIVAGKPCNVYKYHEEYYGNCIYYVWNDLIMKSIRENGEDFEISEFQENPHFPDNIFDIPNNISFNEIVF